MPVNTEPQEIEISQSIGSHLVIATKDRIEVYTEPGGKNSIEANNNRELIHQQPINYPPHLAKEKDREAFLRERFNEVAKKTSAGKFKNTAALYSEPSLDEQLRNATVEDIEVPSEKA